MPGTKNTITRRPRPNHNLAFRAKLALAVTHLRTGDVQQNISVALAGVLVDGTNLGPRKACAHQIGGV